jgi:hypothetical protein
MFPPISANIIIILISKKPKSLFVILTLAVKSKSALGFLIHQLFKIQVSQKVHQNLGALTQKTNLAILLVDLSKPLLCLKKVK